MAGKTATATTSKGVITGAKVHRKAQHKSHKASGNGIAKPRALCTGAVRRVILRSQNLLVSREAIEKVRDSIQDVLTDLTGKASVLGRQTVRSQEVVAAAKQFGLTLLGLDDDRKKVRKSAKTTAK